MMKQIIRQVLDTESYTPHDFLMWIDEILKISGLTDECDQFDFMDFLINEARYNGIKRLDKTDYLEEYNDFVKFIKYMCEKQVLIESNDIAYRYWLESMTGDYAGIPQKKYLN